MKFNNVKDIEQYLQAIPDFRSVGEEAANFSLNRFRDFCGAIGNPQEQFPSIHVAGSNGKGSTCHILASVYRQLGLKVGVYTSPHICSYTERFTINWKEIAEQDLVDFFNRYEPLLVKYRLTYFEISTAIAFWWFARQEISLGIIEVGLGGRLDATNIITPLASVITSVSMEHAHILGDTIEAIAGEKAGTIKPAVPVVIGKLPPAAEKTIRRKAASSQSPLLSISPLQPRWEQGTFFLEVNHNTMRLPSSLLAPVQAYNIAAAWQVTQALDAHFSVTEQQFCQGIKNVHMPKARFERISPEYQWYFDGAHNVEAVQALKRTVKTIQPVEETTLVLALMQDKVNEKVMKEFSEFKKIVYYTLTVKRAAPIKQIARWLPRVAAFPKRQEASQRLLKEFSSELVIFTGSFYFYATVRDWLSTFTINR